MNFLKPFLFIIVPLNLLGQHYDSTETKSAHNVEPIRWLIPASLITLGTLTMLDKDADEFFISNFEVREERNEKFMGFSNHLDDYLQHVPSASVFILSACRVRGKHDLPNQVKLYLKSELLSLTTAYILKYTVGESRPDTGVKNSFPSGHTTQAFTAAAFLSKEYGHKSIWISIGAYTAAATVGVFRMLNNRHWISDVLVGSGIGILSTQVVYYFHDDTSKQGKFIRASRISPFSSYGSTGISVVLKF